MIFAGTGMVIGNILQSDSWHPHSTGTRVVAMVLASTKVCYCSDCTRRENTDEDVECKL